MNNKIALINRDLHNRLFYSKDEADQEPQKIYRRHPLPPQIMLKNMIKKGLSNTQQNFLSRPKTATSNFTRAPDGRNSMSHLRPGGVPELRKGLSVKKPEAQSETHVGFDMNVDQPQQFEEFGDILNRIKWERQQEGRRKKVKLQKYCQRKFDFAWKKYNIPT